MSFSRAWYKAMTIPNIIGAFRMTGMYPFNRDAIEVIDFIPHSIISLTEATSLAFIPLYSASLPAHRLCALKHDQVVAKTDAVFTQEEHARFLRRFEKGYDLMNDRNKYWLKIFHSSSVPESPPNVNTCSIDTSYSDISGPLNLLLGAV